MADWRERGYVPDSDDEEEEERDVRLVAANHEGLQDHPSLRSEDRLLRANVNEPVHGESAALTKHDTIIPKSSSDISVTPNSVHEKVVEGSIGHGEIQRYPFTNGEPLPDPVPQRSESVHTTAARLGNELQKGLQTIHDVLAGAKVDDGDETDSPLSSLPSSPPLSPRTGVSPQHRTPLTLDVGPTNHAINESLAQQLAAAVVRRSFRTRAPIQLHPYALEDAKYRQSWKERGLQPVHVPVAAAKPVEPTKDDSQGTDTYESSQAQSSDERPPLSSLPPENNNEESQSPIRSRRLLHTAPDISFDDDLPALSDLLQSHSTQIGTRPTQVSKPGRRPVMPPMRTNDDGYRIYDLPEDENVSEGGAHKDRASFIVPPSPPRSRGTLSSQDGLPSGSHVPWHGDTTPAALPTPLLSSDRQRSKRPLELQSLSSSESGTVGNEDDSATSSGHEDSEKESQGTHVLRRRIKGVLPASWLKLDIKKQKKSDVQRRHGHSPVKPALEKGVAQRSSTMGATGMHAQNEHEKRRHFDADLLQASSESDSDDLVMVDVDDLSVNDQQPWIEDVVEDNAIDAMLAPRQRKAATSRRKQRKSKDTWMRSKSLTTARSHDMSRPTHRGSVKTAVARNSNSEPRPRKQLKKRHKTQRLTIMDAPGFQDKDIPRFLRIAGRRRAGNAETKAQNLATKYLRLETTQDTLDVNRELERGRTRPGRGSGPGAHSTTRTPLNVQQSLIEVGNSTTSTLVDQRTSQLDTLKRSTKATLQRIRSNHVRDQSMHSARRPHEANYHNALVDHFQHRNTRHNQANLNQQYDTPGDLEQTESVVNSRLTSLSTLRRVPHPPSKRKEIPTPVLQEEYTPALPIRRRPPKAHAPRKHAAKSFQKPGNGVVHHEVASREALQDPMLDESASRSSYHPDSKAFQDFNYPPKGALLFEDMALYSPIVGPDGLLSKTMEFMTDLSRMFEGSGASTPVAARGADQAAPSHHWLGVKEMMIQAFKAIASSIGRQEEQHLNPADGNDALSRRARESVDSMIDGLNEGLSFDNNIQLEDFVSSALDQIDRLIEELEALRDNTSTPEEVTVTLSILNRLTVFGYQLSRLTTLVGKVLETRCVGSRQRLATLAFSMALRVDFLKSLNFYIADLSQNPWVAEAAFTRKSETELETVFLLQKVGFSQVCISKLNDILSSRLTIDSLQLDASEKLACTILILACVFSILGKDVVGTYGDENADSLISSGFSALSSAINAFFNLVIQEQSKSKKRLDMLDVFGRRALQWCLWLARSVNRGVADNLLRQIFKYYSTKTVNMLDLFGTTSPAAPNFLELQLPAKDIVPEPDDTDFQLFLKMIAFTLGRSALTDADDPATLRRQGLRKVSLVFSLLPNNGPDVDVEKSIRLADLAAMENRYLLLLTLYHYSPVGYKPDLTYIKNLVEFGKAHYAVCNLVIKCWASIVRSVVLQPMSTMDLHQLAVWMQDMIFQIYNKLKDAFVDETAPADSVTHENNRKNANALLCSLAERYAEAIDLSLQESQARQLLTGEHLDQLLALCNPQPWLEDSTISCILKVVTSYLRKCEEPNPLVLDLRQQLRRILTAQLGRALTLDGSLLTSMVEMWFQVARTMVLSGNDSWDLYMSQHGTYSFSRIAGNEAGRRCHILLLSKIAAADKAYFKAELYFFFEAWLSSILVPVNDVAFEHILTNTLIQMAPQVLALGGLRGNIANGTPDFLFTREDLVHYRLQIVRHVIRTIQEIQYAVDDPIDQGLSKSAAEGLLGVISTAMKYTWQQTLREERASWASFMHDIVFEISTCTFPNFVVDSWFEDMNGMGLEDKIFHFERLFIVKREQPERFDNEHAIQVFRVACEMACAAGEKTKLVHQLAKTFTAAGFDYINKEGKYLLDISMQLFFLKAILPAYIHGAFNEQGLSEQIAPTMLFASPVITIATTMMSTLELRIDLEDESHMEQFAEVMVVWLVGAGKRFKGTVCDFVNYNALGWQLEMLASLVTLCAKVCSRWAYLYQLFPRSDRIAQLQEHVQTYGMYVYEYACSATGLPCSPSDPEFWETFPDSRVRSAKDFGFYLDEPEWEDYEEVVRLHDHAVQDLERAGEDWVYVRETTDGPVWRFNRGGRGELLDAVIPDYLSREDGIIQVKYAVEELVAALVLLGVK
ncbi:hypothetical protein PV11_05334 [Exophiala sideris]|uniref:Mus7/MMS22 family-domain-containing protein n=1 Tax=Exophiala sideris TaxID=1016849 RepID=A0A0D1X6C2_9EURO|nr:hypothetical protein PV11_05334 [Exophiala sideris]